MKKTIGINSLGYNQKRNIADLPFHDYSVRKLYDIYKVPTHLYYKLRNISHQYYLNSFQDFGFNKVDILHFFNAVSFGKKPWLSTFEYICPRYLTDNKRRLHYGFEALKSDECKQLFAMSDAAFQFQLRFLDEHKVSKTEKIIAKTKTLLPSQKTNLKSISEKNYNPTKFVMTAVASNGFFRKGGKEMVKAMQYFIEKKFEIHLHLISNFDYGDYASKSTREEWEKVMKQINQLNTHITCHKNITNEKVIELFKESHIGLLPTYADTFGYSVLEAQSCACPVISTDIFALPEINNQVIGSLIEVDKHPNRNGIIQTIDERMRFSKKVEDGLIESISHLYQHPDEVKKKAKAALTHVHQNHSPQKNAQILENTYNKILGS